MPVCLAWSGSAHDARGVRSPAKAEGLTFIGSNTERAEYPGCIRWESGHVEYNDHSDEAGGCALDRTARCVCAVE